MEGEFTWYFCTKDELTESSPSGRHIRHYKTIIEDKKLTSLMIAMLNIGLQAGVALERWKHTLSIMLKKDLGKPTIDRLIIIQLFEADFNFIIAIVFRHCLMGLRNGTAPWTSLDTVV